MPNDTQDFYKNLEALEGFHATFESPINTLVPEDWYVLISDVKNSTEAILQGKYKDVNMIGSLTIIALLNIDKELDIPFIFGGDGAFVLIPPVLLKSSRQVLLKVQEMALNSYALDVRVGVIPVSDIYEQGKKLFITKYKVSQDYFQAFIKGGGLDLSDALLKNHETYLIKEVMDPSFEIDMTGLECRWEVIPSPKEETLSILIKANDDVYYKEILENLEKILGTRVQRDPITQNNLKLSLQTKDLKVEAALISQNFFMQSLIVLKFKFINILGKVLMGLKIDKWKSYKQRIQSTTDTEKFDDILRIVAAANSKQRESLDIYLAKELSSKKLFYGIHSSDSSLMTCLIFQRHGKHIHFVDASSGGYAVAAKMLKQQMQRHKN